MNSKSSVGVVVIGRNEGDRLVQCLNSIPGGIVKIIYVDSGSTDGSLKVAQDLGAEIVELSLDIPFTAARARNAGLRELLRYPEIMFVQFIDGDCALQPEWIEVAMDELSKHPERGVVCGRRREKFPENTVYNRLCDWEWDTPTGKTTACGGDAMMRVKAIQEVGGYRETMIAGEEPELCVRLRAQGWEIWRLDAEMTLHDAAMTRFGQWWRRSRRSGYAFAEGAALHGGPPEYHNLDAVIRIFKWGAALPFIILLFSAIFGLWILGFFLIYPLQIIRLAVREGVTAKDGWARAIFLTVGNFAEIIGVFEYCWRRLRGRAATLIEYK